MVWFFVDLLLSHNVEVLSVHSSEYFISDAIKFGHVHEELSSSVTSCVLIYQFRPRLIVSSKVFRGLLVHLIYNLALFLPSCCYSFVLTLRSKFDLYLLIFSLIASNFNSSKTSSFLLWPKRIFIKNFIYIDVNRTLVFLFFMYKN